MNKIVPENPPPYSRPFLKTDESEIEVPRINLDTIEGKPNENIILESYSSVKFPSNNNSCYVDPINLEATTNIVKKNLKPQEKTFKDKIKEIEFIKIKKDTPEEKDSPLNEILDSNSLISPVLNQNDVTGSPILKKGSSIAKRRIMPLDSQIFQKKTLSPGISTQIPIDKLSLMIDKENERYVSQIFDFRFESDKNWLGVTIANEFLSSQEIIDIKIYSSNDEMPYKWELKDHYKHEENSCLFGKVFEALDLNTSKKYSMKLIDYEILDLVVLHDLLYNLLICRYFTYLGDYEHILKVHDIYITESNNIFEGVKHHIMVVILENAPMSLSHLIDIRKQKQLKWKDEELLLYMKNFLEELQKIYVNTGWCCEIKPENIFYSLTSNSLKLCNFRKRSTFTHLESEEVNWAIQIKTLYSTIQAMKTLNTTISMSNRKTNSKLPEIDNHITKEESIGKNNAITILADLLLNRPEDYKVVEGKIKNLGNFTEALKKNNEHLIYEIYYVHEKKDNTENMIKNFSFFSKKYESLLQFTQAFECYEKVIKYRQNDLQTNEKSFLKIKYYMGYIFFQTGYFEEAADKLKEVMEVLGSKYPDEFHLNVDIEIIFGMIEKQKKDIDSSIKHFESALQLLRKNGLLSNLKTSQILVYLGYLYDVFGLNLSQIKKAHRYYTEALNIRKAILKNKYQNNLVQLINNLGIVSQKLEKYDQSIEYFEEVLAIEQKSENQARIANAKLNLGAVYQELQNYDEALKIFEEALELHKTIGFQDNNKDILNIYNNIATIYQIQGKFSEAIKYYKEALKIKEDEAKPDEMINLEIILNNLASIYYRAGFYEKSKQFYQKSLSLKRSSYGVDNPSIAFTLNNLGLVYEKLNQDQEALKHYEESLTIKKKFLSAKNISIGQTLTNLMYLCLKLNFSSSAIDYGRQALEIKRLSSGKDYFNLSAIASFLGNLYEVDKKFTESIAMYNEALIYQRMVNDGSNEVALIMQKTAEISELLNENEKAIKIYDDCLVILQTNVGLLNRTVGEIMCKIADVYHKIKAEDLAKLYYEGAVKILANFDEIDDELVENIEDQIKKLKILKINKVFANSKATKLFEEIQELTKERTLKQ